MKRLKIGLIALLILAFLSFAGGKLHQHLTADRTPPVISCEDETLLASVHCTQEELLAGVSAYDEQDGDLTDDIILSGVSKLIGKDTAKVTYLAFDKANNIGLCDRYIRYTDYQRPLFQLRRPLVFKTGEDISIVGTLAASDVLDGDLTSSIRISTVNIEPVEGTYYMTAQVTNSLGDTSAVKLPVILSSPSAPKVHLLQYLLYRKAGEEFDAEHYYLYVANSSNQAIEDATVSIDNPADTNTPGTYYIEYTYDEPGKEKGTAILTLVVE